MKCDFCNRRQMDCNPIYIAGETWLCCVDCWDDIKIKGFTDD